MPASDRNRAGTGLPEIWGVINLTPDSFYAGSRATVAGAMRRSETMFQDGAAIIDIGAESTRPGAGAVDASTQIKILTGFLEAFQAQFGSKEMQRISVDTRDLQVMSAVARFPIGIINDVSGGSAEIYRFIAVNGLQYVLMHSQGTPQTMQLDPHYGDVCGEVRQFLENRSAALLEAGVMREKIIWDTGIGFGKTPQHNLRLIAHQNAFRSAGFRLLAGVSRKSFIGRITGRENPDDRLAGTLAVQVYLTLRGLDILRLHDVREMADCLAMIAAIRQHEL